MQGYRERMRYPEIETEMQSDRATESQNQRGDRERENHTHRERKGEERERRGPEEKDQGRHSRTGRVRILRRNWDPQNSDYNGVGRFDS